MGKQLNITIKETKKELLKELKTQTIDRNKTRINCLIHLKESKFKTRQELSDYLGCHLRTMERWITKYRLGGIKEMLYYASRQSSPSLIPKEVQQGLKQMVFNADKGFSSYVQAQEWVKQEYSVKLQYNTIRQHLIKYHKTKIKSPRKSHIKKDKQAEETFLKTT